MKTLSAAGCTLLRLRHEPDDAKETDVFHAEHRPADDRWSHAKVYCFRRGNSHRLLVTSANFSAAAWGSEGRDGELRIKNFELGVCVEQALWPLDHLEAFEDHHDVATVPELQRRSSSFITWGRAAWDGKSIAVECRCEGDRVLEGQIRSGCDWVEITNWILADHGLRTAHVAWTDADRMPSLVQLRIEQEIVCIAVFDGRPWTERKNSAPPEVDEDLVQTMRDELLFEHYGGRTASAVDDEVEESEESGADIPETDSADIEEAAGTGRSDSYAVPAFVLARQHLGVVDNWADQVKRVAKHDTGEFERQMLRRDGEMLIAAFERQAARDFKKGPERIIGARLAAEELTLRLKHYPEA